MIFSCEYKFVGRLKYRAMMLNKNLDPTSSMMSRNAQPARGRGATGTGIARPTANSRGNGIRGRGGITTVLSTGPAPHVGTLQSLLSTSVTPKDNPGPSRVTEHHADVGAVLFATPTPVMADASMDFQLAFRKKGKMPNGLLELLSLIHI